MSRHARQVVAYIPRLRRYARALLQDRQQAEDLVQETLARALDRLGLWRQGTDMRAWLFTIMHNQHINDCRRASSRPDTLSLHQAGLPEPCAVSRAEQQAGLQDIETGLMQLPEDQRAVLLLVSLEGLSYRQTAEVLGIRTGTVMSRLHRGRERLRAWLDGVPETRVETIRRVK